MSNISNRAVIAATVLRNHVELTTDYSLVKDFKEEALKEFPINFIDEPLEKDSLFELVNGNINIKEKPINARQKCIDILKKEGRFLKRTIAKSVTDETYITLDIFEEYYHEYIKGQIPYAKVLYQFEQIHPDCQIVYENDQLSKTAKKILSQYFINEQIFKTSRAITPDQIPNEYQYSLKKQSN